MHVLEFCCNAVITAYFVHGIYFSFTGTNKMSLIQNVWQFCTNLGETFWEMIEYPIKIVVSVYLHKYLQIQNSLNT